MSYEDNLKNNIREFIHIGDIYDDYDYIDSVIGYCNIKNIKSLLLDDINRSYKLINSNGCRYKEDVLKRLHSRISIANIYINEINILLKSKDKTD